jgi:hypothetical protein
MKTKELTDQELIEINDNKPNHEDYWKFKQLTKEELNRLFDLIQNAA